MPGVSRQGDLLVTGHGCSIVTTLDFPVQSTVQANHKLVARVTNSTVLHLIGGSTCVPHIAVINKGSATVRVVNLAVARTGDSVDLGQMVVGSPNVIIGG